MKLGIKIKPLSNSNYSNLTNTIVNVGVVTIELGRHAFNNVEQNTGMMKIVNAYVYNHSGKNVQQATCMIQ